MFLSSVFGSDKNTQSNKDFKYYEKGFDEWVTKQDSNKLTLLIQGIPVCFFTDETKEMNSSLDCIHKLRCRTCRDRIINLLRMRDLNGNSVLFPSAKENYDSSLHELYDASQTGKISSSQIMSREDFYSEKKGGYYHFCGRTNINDENFAKVKIMKKISQKYFNTLLEFFSTHGEPGTKETLDTLIKHLEKVVYGDILRESAKWFKKYICDNFKHLPLTQKHKIVYEAMFDQPHAKDIENKDVILIHFDQFKNNTLDALKVAHNLESLGKLLESRLNPNKYCKKTADPTEKQVDVAIKLIGDFSVELMTAEEAINRLKGVKIVQQLPQITQSVSALKKLSTKKKSNKGGSFIANFGKKINNFESVATIDDLINLAPDQLEINTSTLHVVIVNKFHDLNPDIYQYDYTWGFLNSSKVSDVGLKGNVWQKVTGIAKLGTRNYIFILEGTQINKKIMGICCHTQLLNNDYRKSLEQVWGNLHKTMKLKFPENGPFAIGVGASQETIEDGSAPRFRRGLTFRVGNKSKTIH
jgi:hypothetical protein